MSQSRQMARLTTELAQAAQRRQAALAAMRQATRSALAGCAQARGDMARAYRDSARDVRLQRHELVSALNRQVAGHRRAMARQIAQTQRHLGTAARNVASRRSAIMNEMARLAGARGRATRRLRERLRHDVGAIVVRTEAWRGAAAQAVAELARAHRKMARRQHAELRSGRRKLRADTAKFVDALRTDRMKALAMWSEFACGRAA